MYRLYAYTYSTYTPDTYLSTSHTYTLQIHIPQVHMLRRDRKGNREIVDWSWEHTSKALYPEAIWHCHPAGPNPVVVQLLPL